MGLATNISPQIEEIVHVFVFPTMWGMVFFCENYRSFWHILPETNIAPENRPLEKEIPIGNHHF